MRQPLTPRVKSPSAFWGGIRFELSHPGVPGVLLSYESFDDLTDDIDEARVFGGIHFRFDQDAAPFRAGTLARMWPRTTCGLFIAGNTRPGSSATG